MNRSASMARSIPVSRRTTRGSPGPALIVGMVMMAIGVLLRAPTAAYVGAADQGSFNTFIFQHLGSYSDISSLWFRDRLWEHPIPYFDYALEYPVLMGLVIGAITLLSKDVVAYLLITGAVMIVSGLLTIWLANRFEDANPWLLALSPTLPLYIVLNWDMLSVLLTVAALLLFRRDRDRWGALLLAAAVWSKFFPIVLVPLVLFDRVLKGRWRDAFEIGGIFGVVSVLVNAPFAIQFAPEGVRLRPEWLMFFTFNSQRPRELNLWNFFDSWNLPLEQINFWSAALLIVGVAAILLLMWRGAARRDGRDLLVPAALAAIAWFFFINKVYSPQYSLWLATLLALLAAPAALAVLFGAVDVLYFAASFIVIYLGSSQNPATDWFHANVMFEAMTLREAAILLLIGYAGWRIAARRSRVRTSDGIV